MFVTLAEVSKPQHEYGLPYLVEFLGGEAQDIADASSDNAKTTIEVVKKYAMDLLEDGVQEFAAFAAFAEERAHANVPPIPKIKASKTVRPEWL